jgi:hypothetical protein
LPTVKLVGATITRSDWAPNSINARASGCSAMEKFCGVSPAVAAEVSA